MMHFKAPYQSLLQSLLLPFFISLCGMALLFVTTPHGLGLSPDSIAYINASRFLLKHASLAGVPPHWPPAYPAFLSLFTLPVGDSFIAARMLSMLVFGLNLFLLGLLLQKSGWNKIFSSFFVVLLICDPDFLYIHLMAWSEPLFLALILAALLALLTYRESNARKHLLALAAALGLAVLVRYAGLAFILGTALLLFVQIILQKNDDKLTIRLLPMLQFFAITLLPLALWVLTKSVDGTQDNVRSFVSHAISPQKWEEGIMTVSHWFGGMQMEKILLTVVTVLLIFGRRYLPVNAKRLLVYMAVLFITYVAFIVVSLLFFDAYIPLDYRILSPAKLLFFLMLFISLQSVVPRWRWLAVGILSTLMLMLNYPLFRNVMTEFSVQGNGFASVRMSGLPMFAFIKSNHIEIDATNSPELTSLYLTQEVPMLPRLYDPTTRQTRAAYANELSRLGKTRNIVVVFSSMLWRDYLPTPQQLATAGFSNIVYQGPDGWILQHP